MLLPSTELARHRASGLISNMISMVALGVSHQKSLSEIAYWNLRHYEDSGYFSEWLRTHSDSKIASFAEKFVNGRQHVYDRVEISQPRKDCFEVRSQIWYLKPEHPSFFYYDLPPEKFLDYVKTFTERYAALHGLSISIVHQGLVDEYWECVTISGDSNESA